MPFLNPFLSIYAANGSSPAPNANSGPPLYGYYTTIATANQEDYAANNVIATTNASDWYVNVFANIQNEPDFAGTVFSNSNAFAPGGGQGFVCLISNANNAQILQYDTNGATIVLNATRNFSGIGTLTYTYEGTTNDYRIYCNGAIIGSRSGSAGVFGAGSSGSNEMQLLRRPDNNTYRLRNSSLFSVAVGNSVPTPAQVLQMHNDTFTNRVAAKLNDSDHQWNLAQYPEAPATLPDNTTGTSADFSLEGAQPPNRLF